MLILAQRDMLQLYKIKFGYDSIYNILLVFWDYIIRNVIIVDNEKGISCLGTNYTNEEKVN